MTFSAGKARQDAEEPEDGFRFRMPITYLSLASYVSLLKSCIRRRSLADTRHLHAHLTHHGIHCDGLLGSFLVVALAKCGAMDDALHLSCSLPHRTLFCWAAIICTYVECSNWLEALDSFRCMQDDGISPSATIYASVLKACGSLADLAKGRALHGEALKRGFTSEIFVGNTLVSMYGKCGAVQDAEVTFCSLPEQNVVSWTAMLSVYVEQRQGHRALCAYRQMLEEAANPNLLTVSFALKACNILADSENFRLREGMSIRKVLEIGHALHAYALRKGFASDVVIGTALLSLYGKCGVITEAENAFKALLFRDIAMWNSMLSAYKNQGHEEQVLLLYKHMQDEGLTPNQLTFMGLLEACGNMATRDRVYVSMALDIGRGLHCDIKRIGYTCDVLVGTALVSMYGKCGALLEAEMVFSMLHQRNVATWTAMLCACMDQGEAEKALSLCSQMQKEDLTLDDITFLAILQSCAETACLSFLKRIHYTIISVGYDSIPFIGATLIHGYGRCASMLDGQATFTDLAEPALESWNACIVGHSGVGNLSASMCVFEELRMAGMNADEATFAGVLSVCSHSGFTANFEYLRSMSEDHGLNPDMKHYVTVIDLLGRAGQLKEAIELLKQMSVLADPTAWSCLLGACCIHGNTSLAKIAFEHAIRVHPEQVDTYVLLSNACASDTHDKLVGEELF